MTKGALVGLMPAFGASLPNVVAFQFNPETLRHSWTQTPPATTGSNPLAVPGNPSETFSFSLAMDVTDQLALNQTDPQRLDAESSGIYSRLAALEMLMFPADTGTSPTGGTGAPGGGAGAPAGEHRPVPSAQVPAVLFVWGDGRIVPVRVTSLTITEKLFDAALNPTHADAQIDLRVLTPDDIKSVGALKDIVDGAYEYTQRRREALAAFNLTSAARSMTLPHFP